MLVCVCVYVSVCLCVRACMRVCLSVRDSWLYLFSSLLWLHEKLFLVHFWWQVFREHFRFCFCTDNLTYDVCGILVLAFANVF